MPSLVWCAVAADPQLLREFVAESRDRVALAEAAILLLEARPDDAESINTVLRAFHTIKGASGLLGLRRSRHWPTRRRTC